MRNRTNSHVFKSQLFRTLVFLFFFPFIAYGQTPTEDDEAAVTLSVTTCSQVATATELMTWTGAVSTDWNNACNWSPNGVPMATNSVSIPATTNDPIISSGTSVAKSIEISGSGASLTVNAGATLTVSSEIGLIISNTGHLTNRGIINSTNTYPSSNSQTAIVLGQNATMDNYGTLNLTSLENRGLEIGNNAIFRNYSGGNLVINARDGVKGEGPFINDVGATITIAGTSSAVQYNGTLNNSGIIDLTGQMGCNSGSQINNNACGIIKVTGAYFNSTSATTTNTGFLLIGGMLHSPVSGIFTNTGVLKYGALNVSSNFTNSGNAAVVVKNAPLPIFTYGGTYNGTINGIFTDAAATTSAGTFTAPNTFTPSTYPAGTTTYYAKITPSGGACTYIVPFTYTRPTLTAGNITNPTTCGGTGSIAFTTSNVLDGTYPLSFTKDGANSSRNVMVTNSAFTLSSLTTGVYTNFSLNVYGSTAASILSKTIANPPTPTLTAGAVTNTTTCGGTNGKIAFTSTNLPNGDYSVSFTPGTDPSSSIQMIRFVTVSGGAFDLMNLNAGTYRNFTVRNNTTLCTGSLATPITVADPLTPTIVAGAVVNPATCGATGSIPFTSTNLADDDYELNFTATGTGATISPQTVSVLNNAFSLDDLAVGTYSNFSLTRTGCTATSTASRSIANPATPTLTAGTKTNPTTCGGTNGSIPFTTNLPNGMYDLTYTGAGSPKRITVTSGAFTLGGLAAGGYSNFSITNNGCTKTISAPRSLSDPNPPVLTLGTTKNPTACNLTDGSIAFTSTNISPSGTYKLSYSVNGVSASKNVVVGGAGAFTLMGLADGVYENFSIKNLAGCTGSLDAEVTLSDLALPVLTIGNKTNPTTCGGNEGSIAFTSANLPNATYELRFIAQGAGVTKSPQDVTVLDNTFTLNGLKAGSYSNFQLTRSGCLGSVIGSRVLTAPATPTITAVAKANPTTCLGADGEIDFTSTNLPNGIHSLMFTASGAGATTNPQNVMVSNNTFSLKGLKAGTYSAFSITRNNCVGSDATSKTLTDPATPTITAGAVTPPSTCVAADGSIAFTSTNLPDGDYTLDYTGAGGSQVVKIASNKFSLPGLDNGSYSNFSITNRGCTASHSTSKNVTDPPSPTLSLSFVSNSAICGSATGSILFNTTNLPDGNYSLSFTPSAGATASPQNIRVTANLLHLTDLKAGTYSDFSVKNGGCTGVQAASIEVKDPPSPNITAGLVTNTDACGNATGKIAFTSTNLPNGTYPLTFTATGAGATASPIDVMVTNNAFDLTGLKAGTYSDFSVTRLSCTDVEAVTKTVADPAAPTLTAGTAINPTTCGGTEGSIRFTTTNLVNGKYTLNYSKNGTATTAMIDVLNNAFTLSGLSAGTYTPFSITNAGCTGSISTSKTLTDPIAPTLTVGLTTNPTTCGGTEGSIRFTSTNLPNGKYPLTFTATGTGATPSPKDVIVSNNTFTLEGLKAGTYSNFSLISNGCTGSVATSKTLTEPAALTLTVGTAYNPTTCGGTEGAIAFTSTNLPDGKYPLSFTASSGATASPQDVMVSGNTFTLTGLKAGTYSDFSIMNNGCTGSVATSKTLTDPSLPTLTAGTVSQSTFCGERGSLPFTTTNLPNGFYSLSFTATGTGATTSPKQLYISGNAFNLTNLEGGTYSNFSITHPITGCIGSDATSKTVNATLRATMMAGTAIQPTACDGTGSIPFTTTNEPNGTGILRYSVNGSATIAYKNVTLSNNAFTLSGLAVGTYSNFHLSASSPGCSAHDGTSRSINNPAVPILAVGTRVNPTTCGGTDGSIPFNINLPNGDYLLNYTGAGSQKTVSVTSGTFTLSNLAAGGYSNFSIIHNNCTSINTASRSLSDPTPPVLTLGATANPSACNSADGSIAFTVTNITDNNYILSYSKNGNAATKLVTVASGAFTLSGLTDGVYTDFAITNAGGCTGSLETEVTLSDLALPVLTISGSNNPTTCSGTEGGISFTSANLPDATYDLYFTASAGATTSPQPVSLSTNKFTLNGLKAGDYSNFYIERSGCRGSVATLVSLTAPATPSVTAGLASNPTTCAGADGTIEFTTSNLPDGTHSLSFTATGMGATTSPQDVKVSENAFTLEGLKAGTYSAFSITYNNCIGSDATSKMLSDPATPTITAGLPTAPSSCSATDGSIAFTCTNLPDGDYTLIYTGAGSSKTVKVTSNTFSLTGLDNGTYSNFSLSSNGCTASDATSKTVSDPSAPTLTAGNVTPPTTCTSTDGKIAFTTNLPAGGPYTLNYTGAGSPKMITVARGAFEITGLPDGNYSGFSIAHAGCTSINNVTKTISDPSPATLTLGTGSNPTVCGSTDGTIPFTTSLPNGNYTLTYTGAGSPKMINVQGGAFTITALPEGTYSGFSIAFDGCTSSASGTVNLVAPVQPTLTAGTGVNPTTCLNSDGSIPFTTSLPDGLYDLNYTGAGSPKKVSVESGAFSLTGLPDGTFSGFSIATVGCTANSSASITLTDPAPPTITAGLGTNPTTCLNANGRIAFTTNLPDGMYLLRYTGVGSSKNVNVSGGAFNLEGLPDGTFSNFSVTVGGCTGTNSASVTLTDPLPPTITAGTPTNPTTCLSTDGKIPFTTSLPNGTYQLKYTGAGSPQNIDVMGGAFELKGLPDGTFSGFSITTGGCTGIDNTSKTLSDPLPPTLTVGNATDPTTCSGTNGSIAFTTSLADGPYRLSYTGAGSPQNITVASGAFNLANLPKGVYSGFSVTTGGCTGIDNTTTKTLTDPPLPTLTVGTAVNPTTCGSTNGTIAFSSTNLPDGMYLLRFTRTGVGATVSPQNVTISGNAFTLENLKKGTYRNFSITNAITTCVGTVATPRTLTEPVPPTISCVGNLLDNSAVGVCGKNITYNSTVTGAPTITYTFTGATTASGSGNGSGSFFNVGETTVTLTATNSCGTATCSFTITISGTPTLTLGTIPAICAGAMSFTIPYTGTATTYSISGTGITTVTDATLPNSPITVNLSAPASGTSIPFTLVVKNVSGCTSSMTGSVTVHPSLIVSTPIAGSIYLQGSSTTLSVTASGGTPPYQYSLNNGTFQNSNSFYITAGSYRVTVKDMSGCTATSSTLYVPDGTAPITCPPTARIEFNQLTANGSALPDVTGFLKTFIQVDNVSFTDQKYDVNCGTITGGNLDFNPTFLADAIQALRRTFIAKNTGSIISYSCSQQIYVGAPKLADVVFPTDKILPCEDSRIEPTDTSINRFTVLGTGYPTVFNQVVGEGLVKNLTQTYTDQRITNPNGFTIKRTWVVKNICTGETRTFVQNLTYRSDAGTCPTALSTISGKIRREDLMDIPAKISVFNRANELLNNTTNPTYSFNNLLVNKGYRVTAERPNTDWTNGVTTFDVALISRHVLGITPLATPYQIIAADANRNGEVDAADLLHFQRLILRLDNKLPNNNSWRFVPKSYQFSDPTNPFASDFPEVLNVSNLTSAVTNGDFVAIKVGDVNNSLGAASIRGGAKPFLLNTEDKVLEKGKTYEIPILMTLRGGGKNVGEVSNLADVGAAIQSLQFTLNVDKNAAKIESIASGNLPNFTDNNTGLFQKQGFITAVWYQQNGQLLSETDNFTMMTVTLIPTKNTRLSEIMSINSAVIASDEATEGVAYDAKGTGLPVQLAFSNKTRSTEKAVLLPNRPNPFSHETTLSFILPEAGKAKLTVCDILGKVLMVRDQEFAKGLNEVVFDATNTIASSLAMTSGVFVVRLQTATGVAEQKIVLQR